MVIATRYNIARILSLFHVPFILCCSSAPVKDNPGPHITRDIASLMDKLEPLPYMASEEASLKWNECMQGILSIPPHRSTLLLPYLKAFNNSYQRAATLCYMNYHGIAFPPDTIAQAARTETSLCDSRIENNNGIIRAKYSRVISEMCDALFLSMGRNALSVIVECIESDDPLWQREGYVKIMSAIEGGQVLLECEDKRRWCNDNIKYMYWNVKKRGGPGLIIKWHGMMLAIVRLKVNEDAKQEDRRVDEYVEP